MIKNLERHRLTNLTTRKAGNASMAVLNALDEVSPEEAIAALSTTLLLACCRYNIPAQDVLTIATNIMNGAEGKRPEFKAIEEFMNSEWQNS